MQPRDAGNGAQVHRSTQPASRLATPRASVLIAGLLASSSVLAQSQPSIAVDPGYDGSTVAQPFAYVSGTVRAPAGSAVAIGGSSATVLSDGRFFVNRVLLPGPRNTIVATVTAPDGQSASRQITINRADDPPFLLQSYERDGKTLTLIEYRSNRGQKLPADVVFQFDTDNDGTVDFQTEKIASARVETSTGIGKLRTIVATVRTKAGAVIWSARVSTYTAPPEESYLMLRAGYERLIAALKKGDTERAVECFTPGSREQVRAMFRQTGSLPDFAARLGTVKSGEVTGEFGSLTVVRTRNGVESIASIEFVRDRDGVWRISSL